MILGQGKMRGKPGERLCSISAAASLIGLQREGDDGSEVPVRCGTGSPDARCSPQHASICFAPYPSSCSILYGS